MKTSIIHRVSFVIVSVYFCIGAIDMIPVSANRSVLDYIFADILAVQKERSYTKPFESLYDANINSDGDQIRGFHLLGTDINGNDVLWQTAGGAKTALLLSIGVAIVSFPVGILLGLIAGYFGGFIDELIQWFYTTIASIPWLLFVITFLMIFGRGIFWIALAIGLTSWVDLARLIRGETMRIKQYQFIQAARALGMSPFQILLKEILPNTASILRITFALSSSSVILSESILTFIGIGTEPGTSSWGVMIAEAQRELMRDPVVWWNFGAATLLGIFPLVLALNFLAEESEK